MTWQASTLNDDTEHLQSCFLWLKQLENAAKSHAASKALGGGGNEALDMSPASGAPVARHHGHHGHKVFSDDEGDADAESALGFYGDDGFGGAFPPQHLLGGAFGGAPLGRSSRHHHGHTASAGMVASSRDLPPEMRRIHQDMTHERAARRGGRGANVPSSWGMGSSAGVRLAWAR